MTDEKLQRWIGNLLRAGVFLAAMIVAAGGMVHLATHGNDVVNFRVRHADDGVFRTLPAIADSVRHFNSEGFVQFGLLVLIATPILRVVFAAAGFLLERDYLYVVVSLMVLGILMFSVMRAF